MTPQGINKLLAQGEGIGVEFKESFYELNKNTFDSICAFLNRKGGHLLLGVTNNGNVEGVLEEKAENLVNAIVTNANNPQKLHPVFYLSPEVIEYHGKKIIYVWVPESSQVHQTAGKIFDRNGDGDFEITNQQHLVRQLHLRKQQSYTENRIYPALQLSDFRADLFQKVRLLARSLRPDHPWLSMDDETVLRSAGLYQKDYQTGAEGFTLAAALLLGKDEVILSMLPHYKTDAIYRVVNTDRYDDRDDIRTNLIEAYERLMAFIAKHLPERFYQEGTQRVNLRDKLFHEVVANVLVHREYAGAFPAKLIIEGEKVVTENWNKPHIHGMIDPSSFTPFPKNPVIARFFKEIGRAEELGSGVRNTFKYGAIYSDGKDPVFEEGDVFKTILFLDAALSTKKKGKSEQVKEGKEQLVSTITTADALIDDVSEGVKQRLMEIVKLVNASPGIKTNKILKHFHLSERTIRGDLKILIEKKIIEYRGSLKTGGYYVPENIAE